jgi:hypothetical protein
MELRLTLTEEQEVALRDAVADALDWADEAVRRPNGGKRAVARREALRRVLAQLYLVRVDGGEPCTLASVFEANPDLSESDVVELLTLPIHRVCFLGPGHVEVRRVR